MESEDRREEDITHLLETAANELAGDIPIESGVAINQALRNERSGAARLKVVISEDASFGDLRAGWLQQVDGMGMAINYHMLTAHLIRNVVDGHSSKTVVKEARTFAASPTSSTVSYTALAGITVAEAVCLGPNVDLVPWIDVHDSAQKTIFGTEVAPQEIGLSMWQQRSIATSAIRVHSAECQVVFSSHEDAKPMVEASNREATARTELRLDVLRCLTALSVYPVASIGGWSQFDRTVPNSFIGTGYWHNGDLFDRAVKVASADPVALDGKSIAELFQQFEKFKPAEKSVMRVALDRLNQSIREPNIVDKAIDLGIAIEVMLLHGIGKNNIGELRFRTSIRGATFLGGEKLEQLKTFKLLKDAYDLRSKAVHTGILEPNKKEPPPKPILEDATSTCARIARKLIAIGSFPNWEADYVIGGGQ